MPFLDLRSAGTDLRQAVLALNEEHVTATSPLDAAKLDMLLSEAVAAPVRKDGRAVLLAFGPGAKNQGVNYTWVAERHPEFIYIDRIVVGAELQGQGVGRALYEAIFTQARTLAIPVLCEVNQRPPNPGSDAFHARLRFEEAGRADIGPEKTVRYLIRRFS